MKITAFNGSPRGRNSHTAIMVAALLEGAEAAGAVVENVYLAEKDIGHCRGCGYCIHHDGDCPVRDDMQNLLPLYTESDVVVLATPLMIDNVSGMMKVFLDRTFCMGTPRLEQDENGESRRVRSKRYRKSIPVKLVVLSNGGYPERSNFGVLSYLMKRLARSFAMEVIAEIYKPQGELLVSKIRELQPLIVDYKKHLATAGREIVTHLGLSRETRGLLEEDFLPVDEYIQLLNFPYLTSE